MRHKFIIISIVAIAALGVVGGGFALNGYFGGGDAIPADTFTRGLVGYWNFDDGAGTNANDASDQNNDGTLTTMDPNTDWVSGKAGNGGALDFDGSDDYVSVTNETNFDFERTDSFSMFVWINQDASADNTIVGKMSDTAPNTGFEIRTTSDKIRAILRNDNSPANQIIVDSTSAISSSQWYHVGFTYDGSSAASGVIVYIDGVAETPSVVSDTLSATILHNLNFTIGNRSDGTGAVWNGKIDEVRVYNRALSAAEIRYHYSRGAPVAHWKFDEGSGTTAFDSVGSSDGTLTSMEEADWVAGQYGTALDFDGSDETVTLTNSSVLQPVHVTYAAWIKTPGTANANGMRIYGKESEGPWAHFSVEQSGVVRMGVDTVNDTAVDVDTTITVDDDAWHFAVGTYDGSTAKVYIDGVEAVSNSTMSGNLEYTSENPRIARSASGANGANLVYFDGLIDDLKIYNYARTADEIRLDYNAGLAAKFGGSPNKDITRGLVGYWDFNDGSGTNANDASDQNNDGTLTTMDPNTDWVSGKAGNGGALDFDGSDDYVSVGQQTALEPTTAVTVSIWIKRSGAQASFAKVLWNGPNDNDPWGAYGFQFNSTADDDIEWSITTGVTDTQVSTGSGTISDGVWQHLVGTYDGSTMRVYLDGVEKNSTVKTGTIADYGSPGLLMGGHTDQPSQDYAGLIDEVRVYNRALSAAEIRYHYSRGAPVGHWKFDEGAGTTAFDSAGSNDGTLTSMDAATDWVQGQYGTALDFDGSNDHIVISDDASISVTSQFTASAWVKPDVSGIDGSIFSSGGSGDLYWEMLVDSTADQLALRHDLSGARYKANTSLQAGQWYHVAIVKTGNSGVSTTFYVNGVIDGTASIGALEASGTKTIGQRLEGNDHNFNGLIDDVRIYNYARIPDEIRLDYNAGLAAKFGGSPNKDITRGLVGYWNFEDGVGQNVIDQSDNGNDGTLGVNNTASSDDPTWTTVSSGLPANAFGVGGGVLDLDGSEDDFQIPDSSSMNIVGSAITISMWVNSDDVAGSIPVLLQRGAALVQVRMVNTTTLRFTTNTSVGAVTHNATVPTLTDNTWYHVVVRYDGATMTAFLDGVESSTAPAAQTGTLDDTTGTAWIIGSRNSNFHNGEMDEVRIYDRALSDDEVRYLYNKGGSIAHYKFNEGSGTTAFDSTNTTGDGTITGSTWVQGQYATALDLDGSDDVVTVTNANPIDFDVGLNNAVTFSAWINADSDGEGNVGEIIDKGSNTYLRVGSESAGKLDLEASIDLATTNATADISAVLSINTWHHVAMVYEDDADDEITLYVDGINVGASTNGVGAPAGTDTNNLLIGGDTAANFDGTVDDVRVYGYARTPDEIRLDYNAGLGTHVR
jgi:hypothetical protein